MEADNYGVWDGFSEAKLYHPNYQSSKGFFGVLKGNRSGDRKQVMYPLKDLEKVLSELEVNQEVFITQAQFFRRKRQQRYMSKVYQCFVDLDVYNADSAVVGDNPSPASKAQLLLMYCNDNLIPEPSIIVSSGRGLYAKWIFDSPVPRSAFLRWRALERELVKRLQAWGADRSATDGSRVLRLVGSTNLKNEQEVKVVHHSEKRYSFDELAKEVLPYDRKSNSTTLRKSVSKSLDDGVKNSNTKANSSKFSVKTLNAARLRDMFTLGKLRGGFREGERMTFLMWILNFRALSRRIDEKSLLVYAHEVIGLYFPDFHLNESELSTLLDKVIGYQKGQTVVFNGKIYPPLYTPTNLTMIEKLGVTSEEMGKLTTIIDDDEKRRRQKIKKQQQRRSAGVQPRAEYESNSLSRQKPWEQMGIGRTTYYKRKKLGQLP